MTYVLLIYRALGRGASLAPEVERATLARHRRLQADASSRGDLHAVAQLGEGARTVKRRAEGHEIADGPYVEAKEWLVGFYLLDCADEAEAAERAGLLADADHVVEVRPASWTWKR